jgi:hypothetical protein
MSQIGDIETPEEFAALNEYSHENFGIRFWGRRE